MKAARMRSANAPAWAGRGRPMGDPGLFSFLGKVGKAALGGAVGLLTGGPGGAIAGITSGFAPQPRGELQLPMSAPPGSFPTGPGTSVQKVPGVRGAVQRALPGGATGFQAVGCPPGFHANKADYFLRDGTFVAAGTRCVRNRRRNPLNPRALRRAVARVEGGKVWQAKLREVETGRYTKAGTRKPR